MYRPNYQQLSGHNYVASENRLALVPVRQTESGTAAKPETNGASSHDVTLFDETKRQEEELEKLGLRIKLHEDNIKFLKARRNNIDEQILDIQVTLSKYHLSNGSMTQREDLRDGTNKGKAVGQVPIQANSAGGVLYKVQRCNGTQVSNIPLFKDVLGIVAVLGKVDNDNLSRLLSEYLGTKTMQAVVCKTFAGVKAMESYDKDGSINKILGIHGLASSIGETVDGRYDVICLENITPFVGEFVPNDPQRRLDILKPRLPSGELPRGFLGYAVNMIHVEHSLSYLTADGDGLRETLFYHLFSNLQVYETREEMMQALPFITDGALSLDGGIVRGTGVFSLGSREEVAVKFLIQSAKSCLPENYYAMETELKDKKCVSEAVQEDIQREEALLAKAKFTFQMKRKEFLQFIAQSSQSLQIQQQQQQQTPVGQKGLARRRM